MSIQRISIFAIACMGAIASLNTTWAKFLFVKLDGAAAQQAGYYTLALFVLVAILSVLGTRKEALKNGLLHLVRLALVLSFIIGCYVIFKVSDMFAVKVGWGLYGTAALSLTGLLTTFVLKK